MKKIKYLVLPLIAVFAFSSCIDDDNDALTGDKTIGGLVEVNNPLISYVVGSGNTYTANGSIYQGTVQTTSVDIYNSFTNSVTGDVSNRVLLKTIDIPNTTIGNISNFQVSFNYAELIANIQLNGAPLPTNDAGLNIGDFWSLEYVSKTSENSSHNNSSTTKVAVGTRYAGVYSVIESAYWNSGNLIGADWNGSERIIESVNSTVYRHVGLAFWDDNEFFFTVDNTTGKITVLDTDLEGNALLLNTSPVMTCEGAGGYAFESIPCNITTSVAVPDDINGQDELNFTVGYFRGIGQTREFFEKLVKKVD